MGEAGGRHRRLVRVGLIAFGLLIALVMFVSAFDGAWSLSSVVDVDARRRLILDVVARLLRGAGLLGVMVSQAVVFRDWSTFLRPFTPIPGVPRSRRVVRRMGRQVEGREPPASSSGAPRPRGPLPA